MWCNGSTRSTLWFQTRNFTAIYLAMNFGFRGHGSTPCVPTNEIPSESWYKIFTWNGLWRSQEKSGEDDYSVNPPNVGIFVEPTVRLCVRDYGNHTGFILFSLLFMVYGQVVESVDTHVSKICAVRRVGSTPTLATNLNKNLKLWRWRNYLFYLQVLYSCLPWFLVTCSRAMTKKRW